MREPTEPMKIVGWNLPPSLGARYIYQAMVEAALDEQPTEA
jgi:hypothetical protein